MEATMYSAFMHNKYLLKRQAIALQGKYSYELASKLHKYSGIVTEQGYVRFQVSKHIYVTLT